MIVRLGINTGFALNRFTTPEEWIPLVADTFGIKTVQFTADLLNPALPEDILQDQMKRILSLKAKHGLDIKYTFTSAFTRVNHLAHPDASVRQYWQDWFCRFVDISAELGAECMGSHFGILTVRDYKDVAMREERFRQNVEGWRKIADYAAKKNLKYLLWEPMSIGREMGETIAETKRIQEVVNKDIAIPMWLCLDVDHGDVASANPADTDPYCWIKEFAKETKVIHLKQSSSDKSGHWSFTNEKNTEGKITPEKLMTAFREADVREITLLLELSFREREPFESRVVTDIKASVDFWRPYTAE